MAFEIANDLRAVSIVQQDDSLFDGMYDGTNAYSILPQIHAEFYGSFTVTVGMLPQLHEEIKHLIEVRRNEIVPRLMREHQVTAKTPEILEPIMTGLLARDAIYAKLTELLDLCDDSLARQQPIVCLGD
jgi:hypothetical protein